MGLPFDSTPSVFDNQFFVETQLKGNQLANNTPADGEAQSAVTGELRLMSDNLLARDPATSCAWQANVNSQSHMATTFQAAFAKLQVTGQDVNQMVDCSDVIPSPPPLPIANAKAFFPPGASQADVEQSCALAAFPKLQAAVVGTPAVVANIVQNPLTQGNCNDDGSGCVMAGF